MKKLLSIILTVTMIITTVVFAEISEVGAANKSGDFDYIVLKNGTVQIRSYNNLQETYLRIPSEIDGYKVTSIGYGAFPAYEDDMYNLRTLIIPNTVTDIENRAFSGCRYLEKIVISNGVKKIGRGILEDNKGLVSVNIPASVTKMQYNPFEFCKALRYINVDKNNKNYCSIDGILYSRDKKNLIAVPCGKTFSFGTFVVPNTVTSIELNALSLNPNYKCIVIPQKVTTIRNQNITAFWPEADWEWAHEYVKYNYDIVIVGKSKSAAEKFAKRQKLNFVTLPTSMKLNKTKLTLGKGEKYTIIPSLSPSNAMSCYTWKTSNKSIVGVDSKGNIKTYAKGKANIYCRSTYGLTKKCVVTVKKEPKKVTLNKTSVKTKPGRYFTLTKKLPKGSYASKFKWSSSDKKVASVIQTSDDKAIVIAKKKGTSKIKIKLYNGKTATCKVTVK